MCFVCLSQRLGGSSKVLSMTANIENGMATNVTKPTPPVAAAKPRRAARFAKTNYE